MDNPINQILIPSTNYEELIPFFLFVKQLLSHFNGATKSLEKGKYTM